VYVLQPLVSILHGGSPAGTGKSHLLLALGHAAVEAGHRVRYFAATDLVETLYRGLADNSVGRLIDNLLRAALIQLDELGFAPLDATGGQLLFRRTLRGDAGRPRTSVRPQPSRCK
jgi:DNA replication protein DnaC